MRGARSQLLDKHVARDDSKERLLLRNFGGRSPELIGEIRSEVQSQLSYSDVLSYIKS